MTENTFWEISKTVLPQHTDHAGVMWHGSYLNWLEESRIEALTKVGVNYEELTIKGYELPVVQIDIKFKQPIFLGDRVTLNSIFTINKSPKINIKTYFYDRNNKVKTIADIKLVLIYKSKFSMVRKRPDFLINPFKILNRGLINPSLNNN